MKKYKPYLAVLLVLVLGISCQKDPILNKVPLANAGSPATITLPTNTVTVTGTGTDADGSIVAYLWSQVSGPAASTIVNPGSASTAINGFVQGTYVFQLMVTDNDGATGVATVSVIVNANPNPTTLTLQPANNPNEKMLIVNGGQDNSGVGMNELVVDAWTVNSNAFIGRAIFKFDFGTIPATATIQSAHLFLYSNTPPLNGNQIDANYGANNGLILQQITANWSPAAATWGNQPATTTTNQILISTTAQSSLDIDIDVTSMVGSMVSANANYGFLLKLQNEVSYTSRMFVSSFHPTKADKHPKLVITYK